MLARLVAICVLLMLVSCGADGSSNSSTNAANIARNAETCAGCTLPGSGECVNGDSPTACGLGGGQCQSCDTGFCAENGQCIEPPSCGPDNCEGCCDSNGLCVDGEAQDECGVSGLTCDSCASNATCQSGSCVQECGPDSCAGCCGPGGLCVPGNMDDTCGRGGDACTDCVVITSVCSDGLCVAPDCAATCAGCCVGGDCVVVPTGQQCGAGGSACVDCGDGRFCQQEGCAVDPGSEWTLSVTTGVVVATTAADLAWDGFGGLPDPIIEATVGGQTAASSFITDTLAPAWNEDLLTVTAEDLFAGIQFRYLDDDVALDDVICEVTLPLDDLHIAFDGDVVETRCPNQPGSFFRWRLTFAD